MNNFNYYKNQIERLDLKSEVITVRLSDFDGNASNYFSVNLESIPELRKMLDTIEANLKQKEGK